MGSLNRVLVIVNLNKPDTRIVAEEIRRYLAKHRFKYQLFMFRDKPIDPDSSGFDLVITLGGDGTVLYAARLLANHPVPILAVNMGDVGFITEVCQNEWETALEDFLRGELGISERLMLLVKVQREGQSIATFNGLNDCVINSEGKSRIVQLEVEVSSTSLGEYRADGIILAAPTGSTAYSLAAGGPIVYPEMDAIVMNPICPFTLSNRPVVIPSSKQIKIRIKENQRTGVLLTVDGQVILPLQEKDEVFITASPKRTLLIRSDKRNFFEVVRSKLNFSGGPNA